MNVLAACIVLIALLTVIIITIYMTLRKPMALLFSVNSYLLPAKSFYNRAWILVLSLAGLAAIAETDAPSAEQSASMHFIEWIWWGFDKMEPVLWVTVSFQMGFVVLLTILYAVLGRHHDK